MCVYIMGVCMYICMFVYIMFYVCMHVFLWMYVCVYVCIYVTRNWRYPNGALYAFINEMHISHSMHILQCTKKETL